MNLPKDPIKVKSIVERYFDIAVISGKYANRFAIYKNLFLVSTVDICTIINKMGRPHINILDACCGDGTRYLMLREFLTDMGISVRKYKGVDLSSKMVEQVKAKGLDALRGDVSDMPYIEDDFYDVVLCLFGSFNTIPSERDRNSALRNFHKKLKKDGQLILDVFIEEKEGDRTYSSFGENVEGYIHDFTRESICYLLQNNGFRIVKRVEYEKVEVPTPQGKKIDIDLLLISEKSS